MKKFLLTIIVLALLAGISWRVYQAIQNKNKPAWSNNRAKPAVAVIAEQLKRENISDIREFSGTILPNSQFFVAPKVAGRLEKLAVNVGDELLNGTLIASLDDQEYLQQMEQARAELEVALANVADIKSTLDVATREFDRSKALREKQVISESDIEQAEAQYRAARARYAVAQAQVKQREAAFKTAEVRLSYTQISVSWDDGSPKRMVGERLVDQGAMLRANDPIVSVLDIDTVLAVVYAIEKDYPHLKEGQSVSITTDAFPGEIFTGKVVRKAPLLRETSRQARVEIEVANADRRLAPGMFVRVAVQFDEVANARVVPLNAVVRRDDKSGIFVVDTTTKTARFVPVTIGINTPHKCEIKDGGVDGLVITLGQHLLEDGNSITWEESNP